MDSPTNPNSPSPSQHWEDVTSLASNYDVLAGSVLGLSAPPSPQAVPCKAIRFDTAGVLVVTTVRGVDRNVRGAAGETVPVQCVTIKSSSTGGVPLTVFY